MAKATFISTVAAASWAIMVMLALCAAVLCAQHAQLEAHPDLNQGPADVQSAALSTELCTHMAASRLHMLGRPRKSRRARLAIRVSGLMFRY